MSDGQKTHTAATANTFDPRAETFRALVDTLAEVVLLLEPGGSVIYANEAAWRIFAGDPPATGADDDGRGRIMPPVPELARFCEQPEGREGDVAVCTPSGTRVLRVRTRFIQEPELHAPVVAVIALEVDSRGATGEDLALGNAELVRKNEQLEALVKKLKQTQGQLMQSEKMASIGQLAAGVAHEINNPVGYVYSNIGTLERYLKDMFLLLDAYRRSEVSVEVNGHTSGREIRQIQEEIDLPFLRKDVVALVRECKEGINRVKKIVQDLRDFSRAGLEDVWQFVDLHQGLESTLNIVWNELKYKCELRKEYGDLPLVECLPSQINQVFMNLLVNAAQAIPDKGVVTIRSGRRGGQVWIEISDTGRGIQTEHLGRLFEPFFTTKPPGQGTGLGLPVSYGIVERHGGRIEVESEVDQGTTFRVWLPVTRPDKAQN